VARESLGDVEHFVLVAILRLGGESYGAAILDEIEARTGREVARSAVYIAMRRLEDKGLLASRMGEATAVRGGRSKRYFALTKAGARQLAQSRREFVEMWAGADHLLRKATR
jgi:DNA-binding PadR family transcriptional regulator